jgi:hypothetical protein
MHIFCFRFVNVSSSLPATANIKLIEIWMLFCLFLPFLEVLLQTYIETLHQNSSYEEGFALMNTKNSRLTVKA